MKTSKLQNKLYRDGVELFISSGFTSEQAQAIANYQTDKKQGKPKDWVSFKMLDGDEEGDSESKKAEILIYDEIGFDWWTDEGVTAKWFNEQLEAIGDVEEILLRINSPGGDIFDAFAIYNMLIANDSRIRADIEGLAASAASFIPMAADDIRMAEASSMMIHKAWGVSMGNADDMADMSKVLAKLDGQIASIYAARSGRKQSTMLNLMAAETWFTAQEAVDAKLADSVIKAKKKAKNGLKTTFSVTLPGARCDPFISNVSDDSDPIGTVKTWSEADGQLPEGWAMVDDVTFSIEGLSGTVDTDKGNLLREAQRRSSSRRAKLKLMEMECEV